MQPSLIKKLNRRTLIIILLSFLETGTDFFHAFIAQALTWPNVEHGLLQLAIFVLVSLGISQRYNIPRVFFFFIAPISAVLAISNVVFIALGFYHSVGMPTAYLKRGVSIVVDVYFVYFYFFLLREDVRALFTTKPRSILKSIFWILIIGFWTFILLLSELRKW